jgi:hypothetical protein
MKLLAPVRGWTIFPFLSFLYFLYLLQFRFFSESFLTFDL